MFFAMTVCLSANQASTKDNDMQKSVGGILRGGLILLLLAVLSANASEGGGKEGEGLYQKLDPFTVNLAGLTQVIQMSITLKLAKPETGAKVILYTPAVRHAVILLLSEKNAEQLSTPEGKKRLILETRAAINKAIELNVKEGVAEVLLESVLIQ